MTKSTITKNVTKIIMKTKNVINKIIKLIQNNKTKMKKKN